MQKPNVTKYSLKEMVLIKLLEKYTNKKVELQEVIKRVKMNQPHQLVNQIKFLLKKYSLKDGSRVTNSGNGSIVKVDDITGENAVLYDEVGYEMEEAGYVKSKAIKKINDKIYNKYVDKVAKLIVYLPA